MVERERKDDLVTKPSTLTRTRTLTLPSTLTLTPNPNPNPNQVTKPSTNPLTKALRVMTPRGGGGGGGGSPAAAGSLRGTSTPAVRQPLLREIQVHKD